MQFKDIAESRFEGISITKAKPFIRTSLGNKKQIASKTENLPCVDWKYLQLL